MFFTTELTIIQFGIILIHISENFPLMVFSKIMIVKTSNCCMNARPVFT